MGKEQVQLPMAAEVRWEYPNPCGYSTGMEDGATAALRAVLG